MSKKIFITQVLYSGTDHDHRMIVSESLVKKAAIPVQKPLHLQFGGLKTEIEIVSSSRVNGVVIGSSLGSRVGIPKNAKIRITYNADTRTLRVGPLLGVMMTRAYKKNDGMPFASTTAFCQELSTSAQQNGGVVFFFTPADIQAAQEAISGWYWNGSWSRCKFPIPNVIYNRLTSRRLENKPSVQQFMNHAKSRHRAQIFNEKYLDKIEVFSALHRDAALHRYLPESHVLKNYQMLNMMMQKYKTVFLKPAKGSLGKGIIRITKLAKGYVLETNSMSGTRSRQFKTLPHIFKSISGKLKTRHYQVQQGLQLIKVNGRPVDFRALVQKNEKGNWDISSIVARIAGNRHFVSNLARGGTLSPVNAAVQHSDLSSAKRKGTSSRLKIAALQLAKGIEQNINYHYGELGVDLAVDITGRVWLLEINAKPSKNDSTSLATGKIRPSVRKIMHYCQFLSNF